MKKDKEIARISIGINPQDKLKIRVIAAKEGLSISEWLRNLVTGHIKERKA